MEDDFIKLAKLIIDRYNLDLGYGEEYQEYLEELAYDILKENFKKIKERLNG